MNPLLVKILLSAAANYVVPRLVNKLEDWEPGERIRQRRLEPTFEEAEREVTRRELRKRENREFRYHKKP